MRKLSDFRDEEALDVLAELIDPVVDIASDKEIQKAFEAGSEATMADVVKLIIKGHKRAVMAVMAVLEGVPLEQFHCNLLTLPSQVMQIMNDSDLKAFFTSQVQNISLNASGSATENTKEDGESDTF